MVARITAYIVMILVMGSSLVTFASANQQYTLSAASTGNPQFVNQPSNDMNKAAEPSSAPDPPIQLQGIVGGAGSGYIGGATAVAQDSHGNIYVTDYGNYMVQVFSPNGTFLREFNTTYPDLSVPVVVYKFPTYFNVDITGQYDTNQSGISLQPISIAINPSNDTVYVVGSQQIYQLGSYNPQIEVFNSSGSLIQAWSLMGDYGYSMASITVDSQGYVYAYDSAVQMLYKFTANGTFVAQTQLPVGGSYGYGYGTPYNPLLIPYPQIYGIALANYGNYVYVAGYNGQQNSCFPAKDYLQGCTVFKLNTNLSIAAAWGNTSQSDYAGGLAVSPTNGNIFVTDTADNRILEYNQNGTLVGSFGSLGQGAGQFYYPGGLLVNSSGYMYVADTQNDRVQMFGPNLGFVGMFGKPTFYGQPGAGAGFNARVGVDVINDSSIYVLDRASFADAGGNFWRISKINSSGVLLFRRNLDFSSCKDCGSEFNGLIVNASNGDFYTYSSYYVYNCLGIGAIVKFYANATLEFVAVPNSAYYNPAGFGCTGYEGIATNSSDYVYTTTNIGPPNYYTAFEKLDSSLRTVGNFTFGLTNSVAAFALSANGNYYLSDYGEGRITVESDTGTFYRIALPFGWLTPTALATDSNGNLYAASSGPSGGGYLFVYHEQTQLYNMSLGEALDGLLVTGNHLSASVVPNGTAAIFGNPGFYQPFVIEQFNIPNTTNSSYITISGRVLDSRGNPVEGATVVASSTTSYYGSLYLASFSVRTNSEGYYAMPVIKDSYFVGIIPPSGSNFMQQWYDNQTSIVNSTAVNVPPSVAINFTLYPSSVPTGVINGSELSLGNTFGPGYSQSNPAPMVNTHLPLNVTYLLTNNQTFDIPASVITYANGITYAVPMNITGVGFGGDPSLRVKVSTAPFLYIPNTAGMASIQIDVECYSTPQELFNWMHAIFGDAAIHQTLSGIGEAAEISVVFDGAAAAWTASEVNNYFWNNQQEVETGVAQSGILNQLAQLLYPGIPMIHADEKLAGAYPGLIVYNEPTDSNPDGQLLPRSPTAAPILIQLEVATENYLQNSGRLQGFTAEDPPYSDGPYQKMPVQPDLGSFTGEGQWLRDIFGGYYAGMGQGKTWWEIHPISSFDRSVIESMFSSANTHFDNQGNIINCPSPAVVGGKVTKEIQEPNGNTLTVAGNLVAAVVNIHLIDPSGTITNAVTGAPIRNAQVTLYVLNTTTNTFQPVSNSSLFSPAVNPETTDTDGSYGWLVVPGEYFVHVSAQDYYPANSSIVTVPPAINDLNVALTQIPSTNTSSPPTSTGVPEFSIPVVFVAAISMLAVVAVRRFRPKGPSEFYERQ